MIIGGMRDALFLFLGDIIFFIIALWLTLAIRFLGVPEARLFWICLTAYVPVFLAWTLVFYIADLYNRKTILFRKYLVNSIIRAQFTNILVALVFFYFFVGVGDSYSITPKTTLFLNLIVSTVLVFGWRLYVSRTIYRAEFIRVILVGASESVRNLRQIFVRNPEYRFVVVHTVDKVPSPTKLIELSKEHDAQIAILNTQAYEHTTEKGGAIAKLLFSDLYCIDAPTLYEEVTNTVSLPEIDDSWIVKYLSYEPKRMYTVLKRGMDVIIAGTLFVLSLVFYPFVYLAIKLDDGGPLFISQERVGKNGKFIRIHKFRTMCSDDKNKPTVKNDPRITRVGNFLRKSRIDELPQLWNVLEGDLSLIGPRPELPHFATQYSEAIPYYNVRHMVAPGLSGWAQILFTEPAYDLDTTRRKLTYDLYYMKNRSLILDLKIALKTIKTLLSKTGI